MSHVNDRLDSLEARMGVLEAELNEARAVLDQAGTLIDERAAVLEGLLLALATGTAESKDYRFLLQQLAHAP